MVCTSRSTVCESLLLIEWVTDSELIWTSVIVIDSDKGILNSVRRYYIYPNYCDIFTPFHTVPYLVAYTHVYHVPLFLHIFLWKKKKPTTRASRWHTIAYPHTSAIAYLPAHQNSKCVPPVLIHRAITCDSFTVLAQKAKVELCDNQKKGSFKVLVQKA